jgi:SAM-dependent methyltransferase
MWDDPLLYELENADDPAFDLAFWSELIASGRPRRVLELACGTGRLTLPLARLGVAEEIVGLDSSAPFLEHARAQLDGAGAGAADAGSRVSFVEGDMRAPQLDGESFDLVMVPFNSLAYVLDFADRVATLRAARSLLAPGGRFAFDLVAPRYDFLAEASSPCPPVRLDADHAAPQLGVARFIRSYVDTYDAATQTLHSLNRYELHHTDGRVEHRVGDLRWHIHFPSELESLLALAGLRPVDRYGSWDRDPWTPAARRILWICEAA